MELILHNHNDLTNVGFRIYMYTEATLLIEFGLGPACSGDHTLCETKYPMLKECKLN